MSKRFTRILLPSLMFLALLFILATPVLADPRTLVCNGAPECQLNVLEGTPTTYPAGTPFFIAHANVVNAPADAPVAAGLLGFALKVDGKYVTPDWSGKDGFPAGIFGLSGALVGSGSAFNFPQGLPAGQHTFEGHWYTGCSPAVGDCPNNITPTDYIQVLTVTFTP